MAENKSSFKKHKRTHNMLRQSRMSFNEGKSIGPYEIIELLKEGSSSKVYLGRSKYTNENVAIKTINKHSLQNNIDDILLVAKQIEVLKTLKHRNIVTLYEIYESPKYIHLITEYLSGKDLIEKLIRKKRFNEEEARRIFFQILDAFTYMHKMNICHRNIRTEHILFDKNNRPKIVGFGYSTFYESNKLIEGEYGSLPYVCPEIIEEGPYNPELADVWSLGVILYVLICGYLPFSDEDDNKNKILISEGKIDFPKEISNKLKDLLKHMMEVDPKKRYSFQKIIKHPWIKPYNEKILSEGINIHITIFPVDERILNIINEFGFDKNKVKNDLIMNKFNVGTGLYKQIVRKMLDLKIKNISDLWSEEFVAYRDNEKNKYENGNKKYEEFILKIDDNYKKKEDFINDFKERENQVVERLIQLQNKKEGKGGNKEKEFLNTIEEDMVDDGTAEKDMENNDKVDNDNKNENKKINKENKIQNNYITPKGNKNKLMPRTRTPMFNFAELMKARKNNIINNNINNNNNLFNSDNVLIVYNKDQDVDIIQQFQEEQNKKLSENIIMELPSHKKIPSTPDLGKIVDINTTVVNETNPFKLSVTPEKTENLAKKILGHNSKERNTNVNTNINSSINDKATNSNFNNSLYSTINLKDSLYSNINPTSENIKNNKNYKNILSGNTIYTMNSNSNNNSKSLFRMTMSKKGNNNKSHLTRGSLYDDFLKKNHPDNVRKTMLKDSKFKKIKEGVKENDEIESEKEEEEENENENIEKKRKENDNELKKSLKLKYSLSFDDDDNEENEDKAISIKEEDDLLQLVDDEDELKELKSLIDDKKELNEENKSKAKIAKPILKKKNVKFNEGENKIQEKDFIKSNFRISNKSNNTNLNNSVLEGLDKFEEKLKKYQITNDKNDGPNGHIRIDSQLEISFHDDIDKYHNHLLDDNINYTSFYKDIKTIKKLDIYKNNMLFNIGNIYNMIKKNYKPINKLNISKENDNSYGIDKINERSLQNNKTKENKEKNKKDSKMVNKGVNKEKSNKEEIIDTPRKEKKRWFGWGISKNKLFIEGIRNNTDKNMQKEEISKEKKPEIFPLKKTVKENIECFSINSNFQSLNYSTNYYKNENNTYNGSNIIDMGNYNTYNGNSYNYNNIKNRDMNLMKYNQSYSNFSTFTNKDENTNRIIKPYYAREDREESPDTLKVNTKKNIKPLSPKSHNKANNINTEFFSNIDSNKQNKFETYSVFQKFKKHYKLYEDMANNLFSAESQNYKNVPKKNTKYNSVKNIKDEVIGKRNEIIEKIQHCQNLLNTIMEEKKRYNKHNSNYISINKGISRQIPEQKKSRSKKNVTKFDIDDNLSKEIKHIYIKDNRLKKLNKNFTYQRNLKPNKKPEIGVIIENNINYNGCVSLRENKENNKNNTLIIGKYSKKNNIDSDNNKDDPNNYSFDKLRKESSLINKEIHTTPSQKLIGIYKRYENGNDNFSSLSNIRKNNLNKNPEFNKNINENTFPNKRYNQFANSKNNYKNLTDNINVNLSKTSRAKISRTEKS